MEIEAKSSALLEEMVRLKKNAGAFEKGDMS